MIGVKSEIISKLSNEVGDNVSAFLNWFNTFEPTLGEKKWIGIVVDNKDPEFLGRCKVNVFGVYDSISSIDSIPWASPLEANNIGASMIVPPLGALVHIKFLNDELYFPQYSTSLPINKLFADKKGKVDITTDYPNKLVIFENENMSLQLNRRTGQFIYKIVDGPIIHIGGTEAGSEGGGSMNCFEVLSSAGNKVYGIKLDQDNGLILTDGKDGNSAIQLDTKGNISIGAKMKLDLGVGQTSTLTMDAKGIQASYGLAPPDPANMGPFCAIPVDPFSGMPHLGNMLMATGPNPSGQGSKILSTIVADKKANKPSDYL
jgi:hypothetical protein